MINTKSGYIPKNERRNILLLSDDMRMPSGVGTMSREIVVGLCHRYNFLQVGAAINHPDYGKNMDISEIINKEAGITDSYVRVFGYNGYGDPPLIRQILQSEKIDAIFHFTDPRFWIWLYQMENEIRQNIPIMYLHVWDDVPFPQYNKEYYLSCDLIACISKQTFNIVRQVAGEDNITHLDNVKVAEKQDV